MISCAEIDKLFDGIKTCEQTSEGLRVATDCLLPSFEQVHVYVVQFGDGFIVHDNSISARSSWIHGVDHSTITKDLAATAKRYACEVADNQISIEVAEAGWLWSAVASVANASAEAARRSAGKARRNDEASLIERTKVAVERGNPRAKAVKEYAYFGSSGRNYTFDLGVIYGEQLALIDVVSPHPSSIAFKHLAFSDVHLGLNDKKYIVHSAELPSADKVLLGNVADLIRLTEAKAQNGWKIFSEADGISIR